MVGSVLGYGRGDNAPQQNAVTLGGLTTIMANGKHGDSPLSDLTIHGGHPFPPEIEALLLRIQAIGRQLGRWPLGENWPFGMREMDWARGKELDAAKRDLGHLLEMLESGRGDDILMNPLTGKPLSAK